MPKKATRTASGEGARGGIVATGRVGERRAVTDLQLDPNNARRHGERDLRAIARSLQEFGQQTPIVVTADGVVVKGNGTLMAAMQLDWDAVDVVQTSLTGDQLRAYAIADNRTGELSDWDYETLLEQLQAFEDEAYAAAAGFEEQDIDALLARYGASAEPVDEDDVPDLPRKAKSKPGQIYELGSHRVACGDCRNVVLLDHVFGGELAGLVFTDPPYNVNYEVAGHEKIANDNMAAEEFAEFLGEVMRVIAGRLKDGAACYVAHADSEGEAFRRAYRESGLLLKQSLVWVKNALVMGRSDYHWKHEPILYGWKPGKRHRWFGGRKKTTVWDESEGVSIEELDGGRYRVTFALGCDTFVLECSELDLVRPGSPHSQSIWRFDKPRKSSEHPTMKPVALVARALENSSRKGDLVFDPFGGSGSTLIACEQTGRRCVTVELDPCYVDVIVKRWEEYTGSKAKLLRAGK